MYYDKYADYLGWVMDGPSRESLFDSLRLGTVIDLELVISKREVINRKAIVTSISRVKLEGLNDWNISLSFVDNLGDKILLKNFKSSWSGSYSTQKRDGEPSDELFFT